MASSLVERKTCKRYNIPGDAHELTFSCYGGRAFLNSDRTRGYLVEAINSARNKQNFHVWAYVFMPEHVHLLIWPREASYSVSRILKAIKQSVARKAIIHLRKHNPKGLVHLATGQKHSPYRFWQDNGGYDRNITSVKTLSKVVDYLHNNPVRRGLVESADDWQWSSAREWEEPGTGPLAIDRVSFPSL